MNEEFSSFYHGKKSTLDKLFKKDVDKLIEEYFKQSAPQNYASFPQVIEKDIKALVHGVGATSSEILSALKGKGFKFEGNYAGPLYSHSKRLSKTQPLDIQQLKNIPGISNLDKASKLHDILFTLAGSLQSEDLRHKKYTQANKIYLKQIEGFKRGLADIAKSSVKSVLAKFSQYFASISKFIAPEFGLTLDTLEKYFEDKAEEKFTEFLDSVKENAAYEYFKYVTEKGDTSNFDFNPDITKEYTKGLINYLRDDFAKSFEGFTSAEDIEKFLEGINWVPEEEEYPTEYRNLLIENEMNDIENDEKEDATLEINALPEETEEEIPKSETEEMIELFQSLLNSRIFIF